MNNQHYFCFTPVEILLPSPSWTAFDYIKSGFLNFATIEIWGQMRPCCESLSYSL